MSRYPTPYERRTLAANNIKRWEKKFPTAVVRLMVQDAYDTQRSKEKREMYKGWLEANPVDLDDEAEQAALYFGLHAPIIRLVEVNGPLPTIEEEEEDPDMEARTISWLKDRFPSPPEWRFGDELVSELMGGRYDTPPEVGYKTPSQRELEDVKDAEL